MDRKPRRHWMLFLAVGAAVVSFGAYLIIPPVTPLPPFLRPYAAQIAQIEKYHLGPGYSGHYSRVVYTVHVPADELMFAMADEVGDANVSVRDTYAWQNVKQPRYHIYARRAHPLPVAGAKGWSTVTVVRPVKGIDLILGRFPGWFEWRFGRRPQREGVTYDPSVNLVAAARAKRPGIPRPY